MNRPQNSFWTLPWLPKIDHLGLKKGQNNPDLGQKQKLQLKEVKKIKKLELNKRTPKQFWKSSQPKEITHFSPKNPKQPQNQDKIKCQNWRKTRKQKLLYYMNRPQNIS